MTIILIAKRNPMKRNIFGIILWFIFLATAGGGLFVLWTNGLLPFTYRAIFTGVVALTLVVFAALVFRKNKKGVRILTSILLLLLIGSSAFVTWYVYRGIGTIQTIEESTEVEVVEFSLVVNENSPINSVQDVGNAEILAAQAQDQNQITNNIHTLEEAWGITFNLSDVNDYFAGANRILEDTESVLLLNESYRLLIEEQHPDFAERTRVITPETVAVEKEIEVTEEKPPVEENDSFLVYISGVDSRGSLYATSRSDVNIVLAVNPTTNHIRMLSVPRDSYVPIAGGGNNQYDKLTHAGIYGINSSLQTMENLLELPINYYAKINFTTLIELVDVLGGIQVDNDVDFSAGGHYFPAGRITLYGEEALAFSRERYSLQGGDLARGQNQLKVMKGMIEKALSPAILFNYGEVLDVAQNSMDMNIPTSKVVELINGQIENMEGWTIDSTQVSGAAASGLPSYAMPGYDLYMYQLDLTSVQRAKEALDEVRLEN